ncbi:hypothetical protein Ciccas_000096 [Cichlidogyrus casuarinus]|uniref:Uncharacterized protein n=1 Tax=Cichlidogyrus casuarinus TaxID=1844966 RepID=A0ABD2QNX0_9PLAT
MKNSSLALMRNVNNKKTISGSTSLKKLYGPTCQFMDDYFHLFLDSIFVIMFCLVSILLPSSYSQIRPGPIPNLTADLETRIHSYFDEYEDMLIISICSSFIVLSLLAIFLGVAIYLLVYHGKRTIAKSVSYGLLLLAFLNFAVIVYFILKQQSVLHRSENYIITSWNKVKDDESSKAIIQEFQRNYKCSFDVRPMTSAKGCVRKVLLPTWQLSFMVFGAFLFMALLVTRGIISICSSMHIVLTKEEKRDDNFHNIPQ